MKTGPTPLSPTLAPVPTKRPKPPPVAIAISRYSASVTEPMLQGAIGVYTRAGGDEKDLLILDAPGSFELPVLIAAALHTKKIAAAVALGCIIKGETRHDRVLGNAVTHALCDLSVRTLKPVGLGVLTVENAEQALARAGGDKGNKGAEAMEAVLMTLGSLAVARGKRSFVPGPSRPDKARRPVAGGRA